MPRTVRESLTTACRFLAAAGLATGLAACQSSQDHEAGSTVEPFADAGERTQAAETRFQDLRRLWRVGAPLLVSGSPLCGRRLAPYIGARALARQDIEGVLAEPLADYLHLGDRPMVVSVDSGSPAEAAGMEFGDRLLTVGNSDIADDAGQEHLPRLLESEAVPGEAVTLKVGREEGTRSVTLVPDTQCDFVLAIAETEELESFTDGKRIVVSVGLLRAAKTDEQLASAIASGMARITVNNYAPTVAAVAVAGVTGLALDLGFLLILQPTDGVFTKLAGGGALYAMQSAYEPVIDRRTTYFLARAGYDPETVIELFDLFNESPFKTPETIRSDPTLTDRISDIQETIDEIRRKQAAGLPLIPDDLGKFDGGGTDFGSTDYRQ